MGSNVVTTLHNDDANRCVKIIRQPDGTFGFDEFRRDPEDAGGWTRVSQNPGAAYTTQAQALAAAEDDVPWLRELVAHTRRLPMQMVELRADGWVTPLDFVTALKKAIGAPDWHGGSTDAFLDSMIYHDNINALKSPYTIRIVGAGKATPEVQAKIRALAHSIDKRGASDRGGDLEITMLVEDSDFGVVRG